MSLVFVIVVLEFSNILKGDNFAEQSICGMPMQSPKNGETLGMVYKSGERALYSCNSGFKLENNDAQICSANGKWTGNVSDCVKGSSGPI